MAEFFGVDAWKASEYEVDEKRCFSHIGSVFQGRDKARFIKELSIGQENIVAYSDSHLDLPFLLSAGCAVLVNPDRKLLRFSKHRNWSII